MHSAQSHSAYNTREIRIAQTFLSTILTLSASKLSSKVIAVAYLKAMDSAIMNGSGDGAPLGILNDARVTNTVTMTAAQFSDWTAGERVLRKHSSWIPRRRICIRSIHVDAYLETMADATTTRYSVRQQVSKLMTAMHREPERQILRS